MTTDTKPDLKVVTPETVDPFTSIPPLNTLNTGLNAVAGGNVVVAVVGGRVIAGRVVVTGARVVGADPPPFVAATTTPVPPATPAPTTAATAAPDRPPPAAKAAGIAGNTCTAALGTNGATHSGVRSGRQPCALLGRSRPGL